MQSWHSKVIAVCAHVVSGSWSAVRRARAKEWVTKWDSVAHGFLSTHSLFKTFISCWLVSRLPRGFRALLCPRVVSAAESQFTFMRQLWLPARNQLQHLCPSQTHRTIAPFGLEGTWDNLHSWHGNAKPVKILCFTPRGETLPPYSWTLSLALSTRCLLSRLTISSTPTMAQGSPAGPCPRRRSHQQRSRHRLYFSFGYFFLF